MSQYDYDLVLCTCPVSLNQGYGKISRSGGSQVFLGIGYIATNLIAKGFRVAIIDAMALKLSVEEAVLEIAKHKPKYTGFYSMTPTIRLAYETCRRLKEMGDYKTIIGGPHIFGYPDDLIGHPEVDYAFLGEAELALEQFLSSGDPAGVKGLIYRDAGGKLVKQGYAHVENIDSLKFPDRALFPPLRTYTPSILKYRKLPVSSIFTSRGCPFKCIFCQSPSQVKVRYHSTDYVLEEIKYLQREFGVRELKIQDDTFSLHAKRVAEICERMIKNFPGMVWTANVQANAISFDLLKLMKRSGCWEVMLGVESGNQEVLDFSQKGISLEKVKQVVEWCNKLGIVSNCSFIIGHPKETPQTIEDTIRFARALPTHFPTFSLMTPFPGTVLWDRGEEWGKFDKTQFDHYFPNSTKPAYVPTGLTEELLLAKQVEALRTCYMNVPMVMRHLKLVNSVEALKRYLKGALILLRLKSKAV